MFGADDTFQDLIETVLDILTGGGARSPLLGTLATDITAESLAIPLQSNDDFRTGTMTALGRGLIEIDTELIYIDSSDGATATVPAWGRGYKRTTAASHATGAMVTINPKPPRGTIGGAINRVIRDLYPRLFAVGTTTVTVTSYPWLVTLPGDCVRVLQVESRNATTDQWAVMTAWEQTADGVLLGGPIMGNSVRLTYAKLPTAFTALSDTWASTGLAVTTKNVVRDGVVAEMLTWIDVGRLDSESMAAHQMEQTKPIGTASQISRQNYRALFEIGVDRERQRLDALYPHKTHWIR